MDVDSHKTRGRSARGEDESPPPEPTKRARTDADAVSLATQRADLEQRMHKAKEEQNEQAFNAAKAQLDQLGL